ncbi:DUF1223 domain-containing protein [Labilithrix luteola]|nr:DUF1223 domain-containing protein [Labilithrix luteola]
MKKTSYLFAGAAGLGVAAIFFVTGSFASERAIHGGSGVQPVAADVPVLVELFTSEGCSSCPPADDVVAKLAREQPVRGARIVTLAHHVDYWDELGWPDPFASARGTSRQQTYSVLREGAYTPQAVVDGRTETTGSRRSAIESAVEASAKQPHATIALDAASSANGAFDVTATVSPLPRGADADAELLVAVVQDRGRVAVPRGENGGRTLDHTSIVRSLATVTTVAAKGGTIRTTIVPPSPVAAPDGSTFSVVAFVQERASRRVLAAATAPLARR